MIPDGSGKRYDGWIALATLAIVALLTCGMVADLGPSEAEAADVSASNNFVIEVVGLAGDPVMPADPTADHGLWMVRVVPDAGLSRQAAFRLGCPVDEIYPLGVGLFRKVVMANYAADGLSAVLAHLGISSRVEYVEADPDMEWHSDGLTGRRYLPFRCETGVVTVGCSRLPETADERLTLYLATNDQLYGYAVSVYADRVVLGKKRGGEWTTLVSNPFTVAHENGAVEWVVLGDRQQVYVGGKLTCQVGVSTDRVLRLSVETRGYRPEVTVSGFTIE